MEIADLKRESGKLEEIMDRVRQIDRTACMDAFSSLMGAKEKANDIEKELGESGFFQKRKFKKELQTASSNLGKKNKGLRKSLFELFQSIWSELNEMLKEIAFVLPDVTKAIQKFNLPHGPEAKDMISFGLEFSQFYLDTLNHFREEAKSVLEENKETVSRYSKYISLDPASTTASERITSESIDLMGIREILDLLHTLKSEDEAIRAARKGVEEKIQMAIVNQATGLIELLETCDSIGIDYESTLDLRTQGTWVVEQAHGTEAVDELFELEKRINSLNKDFVSTLRSKSFAIKSDTEKEVSRFSTIFQGSEIDDYIPKTPEIDVGSSDALELIRAIESLRTWQKNTLMGLKRSVNASELLTVIKTARAMNIDVPKGIETETRSSAEKIEKLNDLSGTVSAIREYLETQMKVTDAMRSHILKNIDSDEYRTVSTILEPPSLLLETSDPKKMLSQLRDNEKWLSDITDRLRDTSKTIGENLLSMEETESFGVNFSKDIRNDLNRLRSDIVTKDELRDLVDLWKEYQETLDKIRITIYQFIKTQLDSPTIRKLTSAIRDIDLPFDEIERKDLQKQIGALRQLKRWKEQVLSQLHHTLSSEVLPTIPMENPFDLRQEKKGIIQILEKSSAAETFESAITSYFEYLDKKTKTREKLIEEIESIQVKNKGLLEKARKILGTASSSGLSINLSFDDTMAYENALQLWWDFQRLISNKLDRLVDISNSNLMTTVEDFKTIPEPWRDYFGHLFEYVDEQADEIQKLENMEDILRKYDYVMKEIRSLAISGVDNIRGKMHTSLNITISQIGEIASIPDEVRLAVEWIRDLDPELETPERIARITRELIHNFDNEIIAPLTEILMNESKLVLKYINDLKTLGIDVLQYVADNVKKSSEILTKAGDITVKDIADVFTLIADIKFNPTVSRVIRERGKEEIEEVKKTVELTGDLFGTEIKSRFKDYASNLAHTEEALAADDLGILCQQFQYLISIADAVRQTMVSLEADEFKRTQERLTKTLPYYPSVVAVFEKFTEQTSKDIFPYKAFKEKRQIFSETSSLKTAAQLLTEIHEIRGKWENEGVPTINRWHKALRMFISMVQPTYNKDENRRQLEEIRKRINGTYTHKPIQSYLYHAVRHYIEQMPTEEDEES